MLLSRSFVTFFGKTYTDALRVSGGTRDETLRESAWEAKSSEASTINLIRSRAMKIINKEPGRAPETCDSCQTLPTSSEQTIKFPTRSTLLKRKHQINVCSSAVGKNYQQ